MVYGLRLLRQFFEERFCGHKKGEVLVSSAMVEVVGVVFGYSFFFFFYKKILQVIITFNFVIDQKSCKNECSIMLHADEADCFLTC